MQTFSLGYIQNSSARGNQNIVECKEYISVPCVALASALVNAYLCIKIRLWYVLVYLVGKVITNPRLYR